MKTTVVCINVIMVAPPLTSALRSTITPYQTQKETEQACRVLDACLQFDGRRLAGLLGATIKRQKTFGEGAPIL